MHQVVSLDRAENYASPEKRELLAGYRRRERRMLWMMVRFSEETVEEDPTTDIYFDWPYPCEGWKEAPLIHLADFLNKLGLDWLPCRIDGCRYGLREKSGEGDFFESNGWCAPLAPTSFRAKLCQGGHSHAYIQGIETAKSAYYGVW